MKGEKLVADVYNALRSNPDLWNSCLFAVFFDEHGGFYDHVLPPGAVAPDDHQQEYTFDQLGVRVPALLISPWVSRMVDHTQFDHTSVLKYLIDKWGLGSLGRRAAAATSIAAALREPRPRTDTVGFLRVPYTEARCRSTRIGEANDSSGHQQALHSFSPITWKRKWAASICRPTRLSGCRTLREKFARGCWACRTRCAE